jgi:hypothetical protein
MHCEEKARLAMEYEAATSAFSEAVKELHRKIATSPNVALYLTLIQERFAVLSLETWCREYCT